VSAITRRGGRRRAKLDPPVAHYVAAEGLPWFPFLAEGVHVKLLKLTPATGEIVMIVRIEPGASLGECYRHGAVLAYTISGMWRYRGAEWVASAGDAVLAPAGSTQTLEVVGTEPVLAFVRLIGALEFHDAEGRTVSIENAETIHGRYLAHCALHGIPPADLAA